jgi:hypothetical protein
LSAIQPVKPAGERLLHEDTLDRLSGSEVSLPVADLHEAVGFVELDTGERGFDVNARCSPGDRLGLGVLEEGRTDSAPRGPAPDVDRRPVLRTLSLVV